MLYRNYLFLSIPVILVSLALLPPAPAEGESFNAKISQAMDHYQKQEYDEAAKKFLSAEVDRPDTASLSYNLANSKYMDGKYAEALEAYTRADAAATASALKQKSLYNIGNALFRLGKNEEAVLAYKKALELDPSDMDAKFNIEYVREQIKKQEQKDKQEQEDQPSKGDKKDDADDQGEKDKKGQDDQGDKDENENHQEPSSGQAQNDEADDSPNPPPPPNPGPSDSPSNNGGRQDPAQADSGELSEEEAERWLSALSEDHKKFSKKQSRGNMKDLFNYQGKDW